MTVYLLLFQLKLGSDVDVIVQRILPEYVIAAIPSHAAPIAFVVAKEVGSGDFL